MLADEASVKRPFLLDLASEGPTTAETFALDFLSFRNPRIGESHNVGIENADLHRTTQDRRASNPHSLAGTAITWILMAWNHGQSQKRPSCQDVIPELLESVNLDLRIIANPLIDK